ncbi:unnamed protein product [Lampetra planeri]
MQADTVRSCGARHDHVPHRMLRSLQHAHVELQHSAQRPAMDATEMTAYPSPRAQLGSRWQGNSKRDDRIRAEISGSSSSADIDNIQRHTEMLFRGVHTQTTDSRRLPRSLSRGAVRLPSRLSHERAKTRASETAPL